MNPKLSLPKLSLIIAPLVIFLTACSTHYSASGHSHRHHSSHVSVGYHGHGGGKVLGALVVGGIIGHILTEAAHEDEVTHSPRTIDDDHYYEDDDVDEVVNGYSVEPGGQGASRMPEQNNDVEKWYQRGQDGKCYLMKAEGDKDQIVSAVPDYACG